MKNEAESYFGCVMQVTEIRFVVFVRHINKLEMVPAAISILMCFLCSFLLDVIAIDR